MASSRSEQPLISIDNDKTAVIPINDDYDFSDDVPFQRLDSPCLLSSSRNNSTLSADSSSSFVVLSDSSSEPFTSIDTNAGTSEGILNSSETKKLCHSNRRTPDVNSNINAVTSMYNNEENEENEYRLRPHSANSIASVWKSVATKTQILSDRFSLCGAQQEHAEDENHLPFHPSEVQVTSATALNSHPNDTIQLRHVRSSPVLRLKNSSSSNGFNFDTSEMRRSCSTPTKFQPGKSGSAFGRVPGSSSLFRTISKVEDSEAITSGFKKRSAFNRVKKLNIKPEIVPDTRNNEFNDTESVLSIDDASESSKRSFSAQVQHKVKMKRRERMQRKGKDKSEKTKLKSVDNYFKNTKEEDHVDYSVDNGTAELNALSLGCHDITSKKNVCEREVKIKEDQNEKVDVQGSEQDKESYLRLQKSIEKEDIIGVDFADFSEQQHVSKNLCRESPTSIPPPDYHQFSDDEQPASQIPPRQHRRHTRTPPTPASPSGHPYTPQPPRVLSLKATLQGNNMSPCSQDSCAQSRMTSRSGHSRNTFSTSLSGSCNRSVTSSVAEADKEVRDTNRRELRRRHVNDYDGAVSIHSSDTTSTNPNTYLALTSNPPPPREGASMSFERLFAANATIGVEPMPYSKLGSDGKNFHSSSSSKSSSSYSSSKSKGKDKRNKYHKMASPTPPQPLWNSIPTSPISPHQRAEIPPPTKFGYSNEASDLRKRGAFRPKMTKSSIADQVQSDRYMPIVTPEKV